MIRETTNLISYPYYTKYAQAGDRTFFRHVDVNLSEAAQSGRGLEMIQGSVSFDDEDQDNCTKLLIGFKEVWKNWVNWMDRGSRRNERAYIQAWEDRVH